MRTLSLITLVSLATACGGSPEVGECRSGLRSANGIWDNGVWQNRLSANRIARNRLTNNRLVRNAIATNAIPSNGLSEHEPDSAEDELFLKYLFECALDEQQTIEMQVNATTKSFRGAIGLAPAWLERGLDASEQRWVSACLLARVNAFGVSVKISLTGPHARLTRTAEEQEQFDVFEGAFYGNIFDDAEPILASCSGEDRAPSPDGDLRVCTQASSECGFESVGACESACQISDGVVTSCERNIEVITVYLRSSEDC